MEKSPLDVATTASEPQNDPTLKRIEEAVGALDAKAAAPSAALLGAVGAMKPVKTRGRFAGFLVVLGVGLIFPMIRMATHALRPDLAALPWSWCLIGAGLWSFAAIATLAATLIPRRGDVLPAAGRASQWAGAALIALATFAIVNTPHATGLSMTAGDEGLSFWSACAACGTSVVVTSAMFLLTGAWLFRRVLPTGGTRFGFALGAAGGALGGLSLHFLCAVADPMHVLTGHVGAVLLSALAGALIVWRRNARSF